MADPQYEQAMDLFVQAYEFQQRGDWDSAVSLYHRSIETYPTAEAYTYLGWTYGFRGEIDRAIEECRNAILVDPTLGNPYNDIGAYLMEKDQYAAAIPWLEKAIRAERYKAYHYAWYNLGRAHTAQENYQKARECFLESLKIDPLYQLAQQALERLRRLVQ